MWLCIRLGNIAIRHRYLGLPLPCCGNGTDVYSVKRHFDLGTANLFYSSNSMHANMLESL